MTICHLEPLSRHIHNFNRCHLTDTTMPSRSYETNNSTFGFDLGITISKPITNIAQIIVIVIHLIPPQSQSHSDDYGMGPGDYRVLRESHLLMQTYFPAYQPAGGTSISVEWGRMGSEIFRAASLQRQ